MYKCPCTKDCEKRTITCHSHCPEYIGWKAKLEEENKKRYAEEELQRKLTDAAVSRNRRYKKR